MKWMDGVVHASLFECGMQQAVSILHCMSDHDLQLESVQCMDVYSLLQAHVLQDTTSVHMDFNGQIEGQVAVLFSPSSAAALLSSLSEAEHTSIAMDALRVGALTEIGNIIHNAVLHELVQHKPSQASFSLPYCIKGIGVAFDAYGVSSGNKVVAVDCALHVDGLRVRIQLLLALKELVLV